MTMSSIRSHSGLDMRCLALFDEWLAGWRRGWRRTSTVMTHGCWCLVPTQLHSPLGPRGRTASGIRLGCTRPPLPPKLSLRLLAGAVDRERARIPDVQTRRLGPLSVTQVGLGCNNFGGRLDERQT